MKILFITPWYPYEKSVNHGIFIQDQAAALAENHEVIVVASEVDYQHFGLCSFKVATSVKRKVVEYRVSVKKSLPLFNSINHLIITLIYCWKISRQFRPDIIHGNIGYPGAFWAMAIGFFVKKPFIVTEHKGKFNSHFRSAFHKIITTIPMKRANCLVAVSQYTADEIYKFIGKKAVVVGNIIDFKRFDFPLKYSENRKIIYHLGFLGVLESNNKGLDILLKALERYSEDYFLHIGGSGKLMDSYVYMAKERNIKCKFYGAVAHWEVPEFMRQLDFFVSASRFESFGMAIVEAMALGLPVVATDSGGPRDFVNERNGILIPIEDVNAMLSGITAMIENYDQYDPDYIRQYARENYSSEVFVKKMNSIYRNVLHQV